MDIDHEGWDELKSLKTDKERKNWVQAQFKNSIPSDPGQNLTHFGFRKQNNSQYPRLSEVVQAAAKRKVENKSDENITEAKMMKLSDFGSYMKSVFFFKFHEKLGQRKATADDVKAFKLYIGHYKGGLAETSDFISYYNPNKELAEEQVKEVMDLENQFSTFRSYYGEAEAFFCKGCREKHKFSQ